MVKNEKGFSHLVIPIVIILAAVIGFAGYRVHKVQNNKQEPAQASVAIAPAANTDPTERQVAIKEKVTDNIKDLPANLRPLAEKAQEMMIGYVGSEIYSQYYRFSPEKSMICATAEANKGQCIAFLYLPPSQHGLTDQFLYARYIDGKLQIVGNAQRCLHNPQACLFKVNQKQALDIINSHGNNKQLNEIKFDDDYYSLWKWQTTAPGNKPADPECFSSKIISVDVSSGAYSEKQELSCA